MPIARMFGEEGGMINWTAGLLKVGEVPSHLAKCECVCVFVRGTPLQLAKYEGGPPLAKSLEWAWHYINVL